MNSIFRRHARGRPPHPDVLTPAEWRVLDEVRDGRSNPEIAERLGLSRNTVKTHVSSILSKLELRDRSDLAMWRGQPVHAHRSPLFAPLGWLASRGEVVAASMVVGVLVAGLFVAMQSGVLTDDAAPDVVVVATATEAVSTPAATSSVPACPVATEVCEVAVELLPAMRAGDGQAIAVRMAVQSITCPVLPSDGIVHLPGNLWRPVCEGQPPNAIVELYQLFNGKGILYYEDVTTLAGTISEGLKYANASRLVAVGCLTTAEPPDCTRGALAIYAGPEPTPVTSTPTPLPPDATPIDPGVAKKLAGDGLPERPALMGLVFNRTEGGRWQVEEFMAMVFPEAYPINDGTRYGDWRLMQYQDR
jgi:DNA-binding CsgD family transcriptional regulator